MSASEFVQFLPYPLVYSLIPVFGQPQWQTCISTSRNPCVLMAHKSDTATTFTESLRRKVIPEQERSSIKNRTGKPFYSKQ